MKKNTVHLNQHTIGCDLSKIDKKHCFLTTEQIRNSTHFTFLHIDTDPQTGVVTNVIRNRNVRSRYR